MKKIKISLEPKIEVSVLTTYEKIQSVQLKDHQEGFFLSIEEDIPSILEQGIIEWLKAYSEKKEPNVSLPFDFSSLTPFTLQTLQTLATIGFSQSKTYATLAHQMNKGKAYRAVGSACGRNPFALFIPCHRILQTSQHIGGFAYGKEIKKKLLDFESIHYKE